MQEKVNSALKKVKGQSSDSPNDMVFICSYLRNMYIYIYINVSNSICII